MKFIDWIKDCFYFFKAGTISYIFRDPPKHYLGHIVKGKNPIIILPGILGRWSFMKPLADVLSHDGHPVYVVPELRNNLFSIPLSAKLVRNLVEETDMKESIIVAHSKGGLIGKYLLSYENNEKRIIGMVSIASPFSGSSLARLIPHRSFWELLPDSQIVKKLKSDLKINKKIISIIPAYDNYVWAKEGSYLENALENSVVEARGHNRIIFDKKMKQIIRGSIDRLREEYL